MADPTKNLGPAPEALYFEPDMQKKLEKITSLGWQRMRWADGFSLLHWACKKNRFDLVRHLLEKAEFRNEVDVDMQDEKGKTPIEYTKSDAIKEYLVWRKSLQAGDVTPVAGGSLALVLANGGSVLDAINRLQAPAGVDQDAYKDLNRLLLQFVDHMVKNDESVPHAAEELMDNFANQVWDKQYDKVTALIREAAKAEPNVVKNSVQFQGGDLHNVVVPDHGAHVEGVHDSERGDENFQISDYTHKKVSVSTDLWKNRSSVIERLFQVNRHDRDLGLIMGLSGCHIIGFANERLVHDFELGDQIAAVDGIPVGCSMELCQAIYQEVIQRGNVGDAYTEGNSSGITLRLAVKRGADEMMRKLNDEGYLCPEVQAFFANRRDMMILAGAALKSALACLPGGEDASFVLGHCCQDTEEAKYLLNGVLGNVREVKIELEFLPGRPKSLGLELAIGSTRIRRFALNAANCKYVGKHYFVADDVIISVGGIKVATEHELKEAYAQSRDFHDTIAFIVKREVGNEQPELDFQPKAEYVHYDMENPFGVQTVYTVDLVKSTIPEEYRKALEKVERRGWAETKWDRGYTLLHWAARCGELELVKFLIAAFNADVNMRDERGLLPKDHAAKKGHVDVVQFFADVCGQHEA